MEFKYNMNWQERDELLGITDARDLGGIKMFKGLDIFTLTMLFEKGFVDPKERQNEAPTIEKIMAFMAQHPFVVADGYAVSHERDDYRITIDTLFLPLEHADENMRATFKRFCKKTDEYDRTPEGYRAWWD